MYENLEVLTSWAGCQLVVPQVSAVVCIIGDCVGVNGCLWWVNVIMVQWGGGGALMKGTSLLISSNSPLNIEGYATEWGEH